MSGGAPDGLKSGTAEEVLNFDFGDTGGKYKVELENGGLNHTANAEASDADTTVALSRDTLSNLILKQTPLDKAIAAGR